MSEEKKSAGGGKKTLIIIVVAVVLTAVIAGAATWFLVGHKAAPGKAAAKSHAEAPAEGDAHAAEGEEAPAEESGGHEAAAPVFQPLEPIVVNLSGGTEAVMRVAITVQLKTEKDKEKLAAFTPKIQGNLVLLFSAKTQEELLTAEGKLKLIEETKEAINKAMGAKDPKKGIIKDVSFTEMIIQ